MYYDIKIKKKNKNQRYDYPMESKYFFDFEKKESRDTRVYS